MAGFIIADSFSQSQFIKNGKMIKNNTRGDHLEAGQKIGEPLKGYHQFMYQQLANTKPEAPDEKYKLDIHTGVNVSDNLKLKPFRSSKQIKQSRKGIIKKLLPVATNFVVPTPDKKYQLDSILGLKKKKSTKRNQKDKKKKLLIEKDSKKKEDTKKQKKRRKRQGSS